MNAFQLVIFFQVISLCICVASIGVMLMQKSNELSRQMLLVAFAALVANAGYLLMLLSTTVGEVAMALKVEYLGILFIMTFTLLFIINYCNINFPPSIVFFLIVYDLIIIFSVWTSDWNNLFYTSVSFNTEGVIPHAVLGRGPLYYVNLVMIGLKEFTSIFIAGRHIFKTADMRQRKSSILIWLSTMFPFLAFLFYLINGTKSFYPVPMATSIGLLIVIITIFSQQLFNLVTTAHESIICDLDTAIIIMDSYLGFSEANVKAMTLFPNLKTCKKGTKLSEVENVENLFHPDIVESNEISIDDRVYMINHNDIHSEGILLGKICTLYDITEERIRMQHIRELKDTADKANKAKSGFLALMSHELRTPINAILGMNEMILRENREPEIREYALDIRTAAKSLLSIVNDILDTTKIEMGKMQIVNTEYDFRILLKEVYQLIEIKAKDKNLAFSIKAEKELPSRLEGDENRIRQILLNLLYNAVKYTHEGSVCLSISKLNMENNQVCLSFSVSDTGIGIKEEDIPKLYEAFERIELKKNYNIEGTGLGINITQRLLELMGSSLKVESIHGEGSTFSFELTQKIISDDYLGDVYKENQIIESEKSDEYQPLFTAPDANILLVDDNLTNRCVFKNLLKKTKINITEAVNGKDCLQQIVQTHFDLIFLDYMMPDMDGVETLKQMKGIPDSICKNTPIIALTGDALVGSRDKYMGAGFDEYLSKPIIPQELELMIEKMLPNDLLQY